MQGCVCVHGVIRVGGAMEVGVLRGLSWEGGRGDMQGCVCRGVCAEGCVQEGVYQRRGFRGGASEEGVQRRGGEERRGGGVGLHLKSNNPNSRGGGEKRELAR